MQTVEGFRAKWRLALGLTMTFGSIASAHAAGPLSGFAGRWSGGGEILMSGGNHEAIRCKAKYSTGGGADALHANVRCASDSYKVHLIVDVTAEGSNLSGTWEETTRQASGDVTGRIPAPGEIQASLGGLGFGIQLAATTNGRQQAITIQSQNTDVQSVRITLRKS